MDIKKGQELREKWGDKPCDHPSFEEETQGMVLAGGYVWRKTGDYICTQCGAEFTRTERDEVVANRVKDNRNNESNV